MNELQKIESFRVDLAIAETIDEVKLLETKAEILYLLAKKDKVNIDAQNKFGRFRIDIEAKKGILLDEMFPSNMGKQIIESHNVTLKDEGITKRESSRARCISKELNLNEIMDAIENEGHVITPNRVDKAIKQKFTLKELDNHVLGLFNNHEIITAEIIIDELSDLGSQFKLRSNVSRLMSGMQKRKKICKTGNLIKNKDNTTSINTYVKYIDTEFTGREYDVNNLIKKMRKGISIAMDYNYFNSDEFQKALRVPKGKVQDVINLDHPDFRYEGYNPFDDPDLTSDEKYDLYQKKWLPNNPHILNKIKKMTGKIFYSGMSSDENIISEYVLTLVKQ